LSLLRWFGRYYSYATGGAFRTMLSDIVYSATVLAGTGVAAFSGAAPLPVCYAAILFGTLGGLLPFGLRYLKQQFAPVSRVNLAGYGGIWRTHSGWSLAGVITTEATTNAHAYIVTAMFGPSAFAAVAASGLMIRPVQVAMNALTEFERAQMARQIGSGHLAHARAGARFFRSMLIAAWVATALAIAVLVRYAPTVLFPQQYNAVAIGTGIVLWMAVAGIRLLRTPESVVLQAAGAFRPLAYASMISSGISIVAVIALVGRGGAIWSIAGILVGETVLAGCVWIQARRWMNSDEAGPGQRTPGVRAAAPAALSLLVSDESVRP
jgi:O-antigen/teichoic acid export membrane protein